jgi:hypothetical protein
VISSFCSGGDCVEVEQVEDAIVVSSTAWPTRQVLLSLAEWDAFIAGVKNGEFDRDKLYPEALR